jgi:DNA (cytosine-5)-methyltransferase 1
VTVTGVDLFCGVGGLTHGLLRSGVNIRAGIDIDAGCRYSYTANNAGAEFINWDVAALDVGMLRELLHNPTGGASLLAGCPPCQPFSKNTDRRLRGTEHGSYGLLRDFGRLVEALHPDVVLMENVPQLARHQIFRAFLAMLNACGYGAEVLNIYCPDYGIPQQRRRLVVMASRHGSIGTMRRVLNWLKLKNRLPTVRQAIADLPKLEAGQAADADPLHAAARLSKTNLARIRESAPGGTWRDWRKELISPCHDRPGGRFYASVYGRMEWDKPSPTITTQFFGYGNGRFGHPDQDRAISLREGAILQSFPRDYRFLENGRRPEFINCGRWIGNAVPPLLGEHLGRAILEHLTT